MYTKKVFSFPFYPNSQAILDKFGEKALAFQYEGKDKNGCIIVAVWLRI